MDYLKVFFFQCASIELHVDAAITVYVKTQLKGLNLLKQFQAE
jgi:hypothetical protein